ncbi:MAG: 2-amino-4-hydroxy-6-hydroxymethyldihydropteridine diphosphokinase [Bacteroidetes bacterium]|nr:MAG: 2-amino-4-hydroxy-6-hydroxymethyldihydropteridine diphosphokinase [Bacteroidota bacterium]
MSEVYLLTGGNMGNRLENLKRAEAAIAAKVGSVVQCSSVYETAAWGLVNQPAFLNQVLLVSTVLPAQAVLQTVMAIEAEMGRKRLIKYGARTIDIDLLFYDDAIINSPSLTIPHPALHLRRFVLVPLAELAPQLLHPILHATVGQLLQNCPDPLNVKKF